MSRSKLFRVMVCVCVGAMSLAHAGRANAQQPSATASPNPAATAFQEGVRALDARDFARAVSAFERSYQLRAVPVVLFNLAIAHRGMGHNALAVELLEQYLLAPTENETPRRLAAVRQEMMGIRVGLATLSVTLPADRNASVSVDGVSRHPHDGVLWLDPGRHVVRVTADRYAPYEQTLTVRANERVATPVVLELLNRGQLEIRPSVTTASVTVDTEPSGTGTVTVDVLPGAHTVLVSARGYKQVRRSIQVARGALEVVEIVMERESGPPGWVVPVAIIGGALVVGGVVAGVVVATQPTDPMPVPGSWATVREGSVSP